MIINWISGSNKFLTKMNTRYKIVDSYRDELWHLLFGLQIYISNLSKQNFKLKISDSADKIFFADERI